MALLSWGCQWRALAASQKQAQQRQKRGATKNNGIGSRDHLATFWIWTLLLGSGSFPPTSKTRVKPTFEVRFMVVNGLAAAMS